MNNAEVVASILKKGGRCLIVGGETKDLPKIYQEHPQLLIWDDNQQNITNKEVPSNVKIIMYSRWVSHDTAKKLSVAANNLHAIKFPMLKTREIKTLLTEFMQADASDKIDEKEIENLIEQQNSIPEEPAIKHDEEITEMPKQTKKISAKGDLQRFIARNIDINKNYKVKGAIKEEANRLIAKAKNEGLPTTIASLANGIGQFVRGKNKPLTKSTQSVDDFSELDKLIEDAISAMKLIQEHLPKVRKETEKLRGMKEKVMKLFGE